MGYITSGIGFDTDLWNEFERLRKIDGLSRSQYIQIAVRRYNRHVVKSNITEFLDNLNDDEIESLNNEIKKRGN